VRVRLLLATAAFLVVLVVGAVLTAAVPELLGLPLVLAPGAAVAVAMLLFGAVPWRRPTGAVRVATLTPRVAWSGAIARVYGPPLGAAVALTALLLATGCTAAADDAGRSRAFTVTAGNVGSTATPYPGWFYAAPLLALTGALTLAAVVAVHRTAGLPALTADAAADERWRHGVATVLSRIATSGLLLYVAVVLVMAGSALHSVSLNVPSAAGAWSVTALLAGAAAAAAALVALLRALRSVSAVTPNPAAAR
jgi:hypothetical protein